jgi:hypothetical protein
MQDDVPRDMKTKSAVLSSPNQALQRAAIGIKCSAAGGRAKSAHERWRARVLRGRRAVAELGS